MTPAEQTSAVLARVNGAVRAAVTAPAAVLSRAAEPADPAAASTLRLVADLFATMRASPGCVGLAAPQIGVSRRVFVVDTTDHPRVATCHGPFALCNGEVVAASRWRLAREGCLSVPDLTGDIKRASRVTVTGQLPGSGEVVSITTDAFEARALQHELDHCAGLLFLDRVAGAHAIHPRKVYL